MQNTAELRKLYNQKCSLNNEVTITQFVWQKGRCERRTAEDVKGNGRGIS